MRLLHGRPLAERVNARTRERIAALRGKGVTPALAVISVGIDPASSAYQERLLRSGTSLGVVVMPHALPGGAKERDIGTTLAALGSNASVYGMLLLTPLPAGLDEHALVDLIPPAKDVEGVHPRNAGLLHSGRRGFVPTTADAVVELLKFHEIPMRGQKATVVGRSYVVGRPAAALLLHEDATVSIAHSKTTDVASLTRAASIVVVAVGRAGYLTGDMLSPGATVIDAGINVTPSGLVGDVDVESVSAVAGALSPVPGGLGAVTTALMLRNVVTAAEQLEVKR